MYATNVRSESVSAKFCDGQMTASWVFMLAPEKLQRIGSVMTW